MADVPLQQDKLEDWPPVLVILDAARYDFTSSAWCGDVECVWSMACATYPWVETNLDRLKEERVTYVTGNPVPTKLLRNVPEVELHSIWKRHWGFFGDHPVPSVHPMSVVSVAIELFYRSRNRPLVLHFFQPHEPYIGHFNLPLGRGNKQLGGDFKRQINQSVPRIGEAVEEGTVVWEEVLRAYRANLELVLDAVRALAWNLPVPVAVTSDHGELLGEYNEFGHTSHPQDEKMRHVPWFIIDDPQQKASLENRLVSLGYFRGAEK